MKLRVNQFKMTFMTGIACCVLLCSNLMLVAQTMPQINARFTNPQFDPATRNYFVDAELNANDAPAALFGMNVRFFYDASVLEFKFIDQLKDGYSMLGEMPKANVGNETSGVQLFNFPGAAAYINGAIQLVDIQKPLNLTSDKWVKAFRICFRVPAVVANEEQFCPCVMWDLKPTTGTGGFLPGGDGLVMTVLENDPNTPQVSGPSVSVGTGFNWQYSSAPGLPYGNPAPAECISIASPTATEEDKVDANGYGLFQNKPNPFDDVTVIEFVLPFAQEATLKLYDVGGKSVEDIKGFYQAGKNQVTLNRKSWMKQSSVVFYRLETSGGYTSDSKKMTLVRA